MYDDSKYKVLAGVELARTLIIGLDPGVTKGVAILSTKGDVVKLASKRGAKRGDVINYIIKFGKPVIVASDVNPLPKSIKKISSILETRVYYPKISLSNVEKFKITKQYVERIKDNHQKDALAAALKAFKSCRELFLKIEEALVKSQRTDIFDDVVESVLKKRGENIADVIKKVIVRKGLDD